MITTEITVDKRSQPYWTVCSAPGWQTQHYAGKLCFDSEYAETYAAMNGADPLSVAYSHSARGHDVFECEIGETQELETWTSEELF